MVRLEVPKKSPTHQLDWNGDSHVQAGDQWGDLALCKRTSHSLAHTENMSPKICFVRWIGSSIKDIVAAETGKWAKAEHGPGGAFEPRSFFALQPASSVSYLGASLSKPTHIYGWPIQKFDASQIIPTGRRSTWREKCDLGSIDHNHERARGAG